MDRPIHKINGDLYEVAFCAGNYFYFRRLSDDTLHRSCAIEIRSRMYLEPVSVNLPTM